jgi:hypothetical protein
MNSARYVDAAVASFPAVFEGTIDSRFVSYVETVEDNGVHMHTFLILAILVNCVHASLFVSWRDSEHILEAFRPLPKAEALEGSKDGVIDTQKSIASSSMKGVVYNQRNRISTLFQLMKECKSIEVTSNSKRQIHQDSKLDKSIRTWLTKENRSDCSSQPIVLKLSRRTTSRLSPKYRTRQVSPK